MPSYLVTGASRGLGFGFVKVIARNPENKIIGLVRNRAALDSKIAAEGLKNVTVVEADYTDLASLKRAAEEVKAALGGPLDYLINNAAYIDTTAHFKTVADFEHNFDVLEKEIAESFRVNAIGVMKVIVAFLPLMRSSAIKKVLTISSGMGDLDLINETGLGFAAPYSISKAAVNVAMAKYQAAYSKEGFLFYSVSPGVVNTEAFQDSAAGDGSEVHMQEMARIFTTYAPEWKGPITPEESASIVLELTHKASVEKGDGGAFVSHLGTKRWL